MQNLLVFAWNYPTLLSVPFTIQFPGPPMARNTIKHRIVHIQYIVFIEAKL